MKFAQRHDRWEFRIDGKRLTPLGVDIGPARVVKIEREFLVAHIGGHKTWTSIGAPWRYAPAHFYVFRIIERDGDRVALEPLVDFPIRRNREG